MVNHTEYQQLLSAYIDGQLNLDEKKLIEDHLLECVECQNQYRELQKLSTVLGLWADEDLSPDLAQKIRSTISSQKNEGIKMKTKSLITVGGGGILVTVLVLILSMQVYTRTGIQGRLKNAADDIGDRFSTRNAKVVGPMTSKPQTTVVKEKVVVGGKQLSQYNPAQITANEIWGDSPSRMKAAKPAELLGRDAAFREVAASPQLADSAIAIQSAPYNLSTDYDVRQLDGRLRSRGGTQASTYNAQALASLGKSDGFAETKSAEMFNPDSGLRGGVAPGLYRTPSGQLGSYCFIGSQALTYQSLSYPIQQNDNFNTENYDRIYDNQFLEAKLNPLSTFSIDVDTASYSNIRRFLNNNQLPPQDAVRIEEMINYFSYDYPAPSGDKPFSITAKTAKCPWKPEHNLVLIGLKGKVLDEKTIPPSNLVFLIDSSGSMQDINKLSLLKEAFRLMVNQLNDNQKVAIVTYAGSAGLVLDSTPGSQKEKILNAIDNLQAGGSTAGGAGIKLAYEIAKSNFIKEGNNRVILATDGDFNVGVSSDAELIRIIEEKRKDGIFLTVLGFGMGNYKDNKMEKLADKGNGNYYYIDTLNEGKKVLVSELGSTLFAIAKDVKIQIEFNPTQVKAYRLVGYENRVLAKEDFNDDTKDAGELGAGHSVTALYEIVPADSKENFAKVDDLKYQEAKVNSSDEIMTVKLRYKDPNGEVSKLINQTVKKDEITEKFSSDAQFAAAVAEFGLLLRKSEFKGSSSYKHVLKSATESKGNDPFGYRDEFLKLVEKAIILDFASGKGIQFKGQE